MDLPQESKFADLTKGSGVFYGHNPLRGYKKYPDSFLEGGGVDRTLKT